MSHRPLVKAVIVAAGAGRRLAGERPKQFLPLAGAPLFTRSLEAVERAESVRSVVLVLPDGHLDEGLRLKGDRFPKLEAVVAGGAVRQESVRLGVEAAGDCEIVVIHDAARPFAPPELFDAVAAEAARSGAAIAAAPVSDTVKQTDGAGGITATLDRSRLLLAQTPQAFRRTLLVEAFERARAEGLVATDEAALVERLGTVVRAVAGGPGNMKITGPEDLAAARAIAGEGAALRVGAGEDVHPLREGRPLVLGGVAIPFERGLAGHSDADVLAHAIADALCGAAGLPGLGEQFPDSDPAWKGVSSLDLLRRIGRRLAEGGWEIVNLDSIVLCEAPRLAGHLEEMRGRVAEALGVSPARVGIKAKSPEGLGPIGRGEGISARAVALLRGGGRGPAREARGAGGAP